MSYATTAQFTQAYGLRETTQLLQDEQDLLTEPLLRVALDVAAGTATWVGYVPALDDDPSLQDHLHQWAWQVYGAPQTGSGQTWAAYVPPAGYSAPSQAQINLADQWVLWSIAAADGAAMRFQSALDLSSAEIDSYIGGVMTLPIDPLMMPVRLLDECCWVLTRCRLADDCDNSSDKIEQNCKDKRQWLKDVAKGLVQLQSANPANANAPAAAVPQMQRIRTGQARSGFNWAAHRGASGGLLPSEMQGTGTRT
jgi:phage gp36-like protein